MAVLAASCGTGGTNPEAAVPFTADIRAISDAIATAAKYPANAVELTSSEARLRIAVSDATLAMADEVERNSAAMDLVAAAERVLVAHPEYAKLQTISVAIVHPVAAAATGNGWHVEDVVEFRRGPDGHFLLHTT